MKDSIREEGEQLALDFDKRGGLITAVVQDFSTKDVLMVGFMNQEAWDLTVSRGTATFWSTSRGKLWVKGETSGDYLKVVEIRVDCDQDAVVLLVTPLGDGTCHTVDQNGRHRYSCFYRRWRGSNLEFFEIDE